MHDRKMDTLSISNRSLEIAINRLTEIYHEGYTTHQAIALAEDLGRLEKAQKRVNDEMKNIK